MWPNWILGHCQTASNRTSTYYIVLIYSTIINERRSLTAAMPCPQLLWAIFRVLPYPPLLEEEPRRAAASAAASAAADPPYWTYVLALL